MPVYRGQNIVDAFNAIHGAPEVQKELYTENWRRLVKKEEALQAQRQTLSEALLGMHVPMHIVLMIIDQS